MQDLVPDIFETKLATNNFNMIATDIPNRVSTMEPFVTAKNYNRCFILIYNISLKIGGYFVILYEDQFCRQNQFNIDAIAQEALNEAAQNYQPMTKINDTIIELFNEEFSTLRWNCAVVKEDTDNFGFASLPPNLPKIEATGSNNQRFIA